MAATGYEIEGPLVLNDGDIVGPANFDEEPRLNGRQHFRGMWADELRWARAAFGGSAAMPVNVWVLGDSIFEGYGATSDYAKTIWLLRKGLQNRLGDFGGAGFIPAQHGIAWNYSSNPDGLNAWTWTQNALNALGGSYGPGRRSAWMDGTTNGATRSLGDISFYGDRFWIVYTEASLSTNLQITVDRGTSFEQVVAVQTQFPTNGFVRCGRVWDSSALTAALTRGVHTVRIEATTANDTIVNGIFCFDGDATTGVHVVDATKSSVTADHFAAHDGDGTDATWADHAWQGKNETVLASCVFDGAGGMTCAGGSFTSNDIGEWGFCLAGVGGSGELSAFRINGVLSGTAVTLDRNVPAGTRSAIINRSQVTDMVSTNGQYFVTSATAAFTAWDVGCKVRGTNLPTTAADGSATKIIWINAAGTQARLNAAATGTGTGQTMRIQNRQARWCKPDLIIDEVAGLNDMVFGVTRATFKANKLKIINNLLARAGCDHTPSIAVTPMWAPGFASDANINVSYTNGSAVLNSTDAATVFHAEDQGNVVTGIPGTTNPTILTVNSSTQVTLSQNANAGGSMLATIVARVFQVEHYAPYYEAQLELAQEQGWDVFDMNSFLGPHLGLDDDYGLSFDALHANDRAQIAIADELLFNLTGSTRSSDIPEGIFSAKGETLAGLAANSVGVIPPPLDGQTLLGAPSSPTGWIVADATIQTRGLQYLANPGAATLQHVGFSAAPTLIGTGTPGALANDDQAYGPFVRFPTGTTSGNVRGFQFGYAICRSAWIPEIVFFMKTHSDIANIRLWFGLFSADPSGSDDPSGVTSAGFRFTISGGSGDTNWQTYTNDGTTTGLIKNSGVAVAASTAYRLRIEFRGTPGTNATSVRFYIDDVLRSEHTTELPAGAANNIGPHATVTTRAAAAKSFALSRMSYSHR